MTVKEIQSLLGGEDKYTTVMTVMNRLSEKKRLFRERVGLHYEYWLAPQESKPQQLLKQVKKKFFGLNTRSLVSFLIESSDDISEEDLVEMERLIQQAKEKRRTKDA